MPNEMLQIAVRAAAGTLLFRTNEEARTLWGQVVARVRPYALVLMPDHLHAMLHGLEEWFRVRTGLRAFALQRNRQRGESGQVFEHDVVPEVVPRDRIARNRRYVHLNPCRCVPPIVKDPLAFAFSTHRDTVGLALPPACTAVRDAVRFHTYVSSDSHVRVDGTLLPVISTESDVTPAWDDVRAAVSAVTRTPAGMLGADRHARDLLVRAGHRLARLSVRELAERLDLGRATAYRHLDGPDHELVVVQRVLGDPRFPLLEDGDLRRTAGWRRYRHLR